MLDTGRTVAAVLTYRRPRLATQSVRHLVDVEGFDPTDVLVVVNGEGGLDDPGLERRIRVERLDTNTGPAGGMRAALANAVADDDVDWVYLCEDDIGASELPGPRVDRLRGLAADHHGGSPQRSLGAIVAYSRVLDRRTGLTRPHLPDGSAPPLVPTDVASWGASFVSRKVIDTGVLPDASLFFGYEDFDFWLSMQAAGFDLFLDTDCARAVGRSVHPSGRDEALGDERPIDDTEPWRRYYEARNFLHLRRRHGHLGWTVAHLAKSARRAGLGGAQHRRAVATGLVDGARGRLGINPRYLRPANTDERPTAPPRRAGR